MVFKAINFGQSDCGKKIETSKKRFYWTFSVNGDQHTLEVISSFLSGKKKVLLDSMEIYFEKKLLNINFEFRHTIEDHSIRVTQDKLEFECYIDNQSFQSLMTRGNFEEKKERSSKVEEIKGEDPFSEFTNCFQNNGNKTSSSAFNDFGNFDMDFNQQAIRKEEPVNSFVKQIQPSVPKNSAINLEPQTDFFGFQTKSPEPTNQFFTGQFSTSNNVMFGANKPITSDNFFQDEFQRQQIEQERQKENNDKGFFGKVQNVFKNLYNQIPAIGGKGAGNQNADNNVQLL